MKRMLIALACIIILFAAFIILYKPAQNWIGWNLVQPPDSFPTPDWQESTPLAENISTAGLLSAYQNIIDNKINTHAILILRNGKIVDETYCAPFKQDDKINIHSCTKSILSMLVGIAISDGYIKSLDQKVLDFFTDRIIQNRSTLKTDMTIRDLLTMSAGLAVNHPDNAMKASPNWIQYVLDLNMAERPGTRFRYSDATAHLLSAVLQQAVGMSAAAYAELRLFGPMNIDAIWPADPQGMSQGFGEINMSVRDLAKIGYLYLQRGRWNGHQLVNEQWVRMSTEKQIITDTNNDYGFLWWCDPIGYSVRGAGEQIISVIPQYNTVMVATNGLDINHNFDFSHFLSAVQPWATKPEPAVQSAYLAIKSKLTTYGVITARDDSVNRNFLLPIILGVHYQFTTDNPLALAELSISATANKFTITFLDKKGMVIPLSLPLDGSYIRDDSRKLYNDTIYMRASWPNRKTIQVEIEKSSRVTIQFEFVGNIIKLNMLFRGEKLFSEIIGSGMQQE